MFITVVHKDNINHPIAWLNVFESADTSKKIEGDRILEFITKEDNLKTPYLYQKDAYKLIADGQIYTPIQVIRIAESGDQPKVQVEAEHTSYSLNDNTFELYEHEGNVSQLMGYALAGTGFIFDSTDIPTSEIKKLKVPFTNSRYMVNRIAREFKAKIVYDNNKISLFRSLSNATGIRLTVDKNLYAIKRIISHKEGQETITYEIDVNAGKLESLEKVDIGDALVVLDNEKARGEIDRVVVEVRKNLLTDRVEDLVLGDPNPKFSDIMLDLVMPPIIEEVEKMLGDNVITEVIHEQVINVETAHILNAWIKNLFVEYLETNMDARLNPQETVRDYIRIENEKYEMIHQALDSTKDEYLMIPDPNGSGAMINVYYTAIDDHVDAYRYFTITHPRSVHKDLTDAQVDAFKVTVRKSASEIIKYVHEFTTITMADGSTTDAPLMLFGAGTDNTGGTQRGKGFIYKEQRGLVVGTYNENNDSFTAIMFDAVDCTVKYWDMNKKDFVPILSQWAGGAGNVIFHKDKTSFTEAEKKTLAVGTNALHVGYSSTGIVGTGKGTSMSCSGLVLLGVETSNGLPPIVATDRYIYMDGVEYVKLTNKGFESLNPEYTQLEYTYLSDRINCYMPSVQTYVSRMIGCGTQSLLSFTNCEYVIIEININVALSSTVWSAIYLLDKNKATVSKTNVPTGVSGKLTLKVPIGTLTEGYVLFKIGTGGVNVISDIDITKIYLQAKTQSDIYAFYDDFLDKSNITQTAGLVPPVVEESKLVSKSVDYEGSVEINAKLTCKIHELKKVYFKNIKTELPLTFNYDVFNFGIYYNYTTSTRNRIFTINVKTEGTLMKITLSVTNEKALVLTLPLIDRKINISDLAINISYDKLTISMDVTSYGVAYSASMAITNSAIWTSELATNLGTASITLLGMSVDALGIDI